MELMTQVRTTLQVHYLAALQAGDRRAAIQLVQEALARGMPLEDLYQDVLQPALYEIGRLWETGQLDVAGEHLVTATTRSVMEQCASRVKPVLRGPPTVLATCVGPELHDLGLHMVADMLELRGWNTLYLGSNMPLDAIVALAVRHRVAVVAASITISSHARELHDLIRLLRESALGSTVQILVGGQPFKRIPELWHQLGADGTAPNAHAAVVWMQTHASQAKELA